jgi:hypothetical protein
MDKTYPTICIPKVHKSITKEFVITIFKKYNFGNIIKIDLIKINKINKVFIHLIWNNKDLSQKARDILLKNDNFKIIYDENDGWYWKCSASISKQNLPKINQP